MQNFSRSVNIFELSFDQKNTWIDRHKFIPSPLRRYQKNTLYHIGGVGYIEFRIIIEVIKKLYPDWALWHGRRSVTYKRHQRRLQNCLRHITSMTMTPRDLWQVIWLLETLWIICFVWCLLCLLVYCLFILLAAFVCDYFFAVSLHSLDLRRGRVWICGYCRPLQTPSLFPILWKS